MRAQMLLLRQADKLKLQREVYETVPWKQEYDRNIVKAPHVNALKKILSYLE